MLPEDKYFLTLSKEELWQRYCGFLDLSTDDFMAIQEELLLDQIERVSRSPLGQKIMGNNKPASVAEYRKTVPITNYEDYEPYLSSRQEDVLAIKPRYWCHSAGRGGRFKWVPHGTEFLEKVIRHTIGLYILAAASGKGDVRLAPGFSFLSILPPAPYASGCLFQMIPEYFSLKVLPPTKSAETMEFEERIKSGFQMALRDGVDIIGTIASVLVKMGERFTSETGATGFSPAMLHPKILPRLGRAWLKARMEKRGILPRDLWPTKAIMASGMDTAIYRDEITRYWGTEPYEAYGVAEAYFLATQSWNRKAMVFLPDVAFFEFLPHNDKTQAAAGKDPQQKTVLLNELEPGKSYEVLISHFYGMPLLRYRMKDIIKVVALKDEETGVKLPQIVFQRRVEEVIGLFGLAHLDELTIWQALTRSGVKHAEWVACKEYEGSQTFLHFYLEPKEKLATDNLPAAIHEQLKIVDTDYKDIESYLGLQPVKVTYLPQGTFQRYMDDKRKEGADLAHLKPVRINPPGPVMERLIQISKSG